MAKATGEPLMRLAAMMKLFVMLGLVGLGLSGCKQGSGSRCQVHSDCATGLLCVLPANGNCVTGGVCEPASTANVTCTTSADCSAGFSCQASTDCTDNGANVCVANVDMTVPDDLVTSPTD